MHVSINLISTQIIQIKEITFNAPISLLTDLFFVVGFAIDGKTTKA